MSGRNLKCGYGISTSGGGNRLSNRSCRNKEKLNSKNEGKIIVIVEIRIRYVLKICLCVLKINININTQICFNVICSRFTYSLVKHCFPFPSAFFIL